MFNLCYLKLTWKHFFLKKQTQKLLSPPLGAIMFSEYDGRDCQVSACNLGTWKSKNFDLYE